MHENSSIAEDAEEFDFLNGNIAGSKDQRYCGEYFHVARILSGRY